MTIDTQLTSPAFFGEGDFWGLFAKMRREDPVHWTLNGSSKGFWSVFKHADVKAAFEDPATFSSEREGIMPLMGGGPEFEAVAKTTLGIGENVMVIDPPRHTELRKIMAAPFLPKALEPLEQRAAMLIAQIFDALPDECDLVSDLGVKIPMAVICDILNIPSSMWPQMHRWGQMALGGADPEYADGTLEETMAKGWGSMLRYSGEIATARRGCPHADPVTTLANCSVAGRTLTDSELAYNTQQYIIAGFETTRNAFAGGVHALLENPEQMAILRREPRMIRLAVEEFIRFTSPALSVMRVATRDTQIRGREIREGDRVVLWIGSANRDEEVFDRPEEFDVTRHPNRHLAFGAGPHFCLGGPLSKVELHCAVVELLERYDGIEIVGKVERSHSNFVSGLKHMPVRLRKRAAAAREPAAAAH